MSQDFKSWVLSQLQDPKLKEKAERRMKDSGAQEDPKITDVARFGALRLPPQEIAAPENKRESPASVQRDTPRSFLQFAHPHREGYWKEQLKQSTWRFRAREHETQIITETDALFEKTADEAYALRLRRDAALTEETGNITARDRLPSYFLEQIYRVTYQAVVRHYDPERKGSTVTDPYFVFTLGSDGVRSLSTFLGQAVEKLPPATPETLQYFGYDEKGRKILWWDPQSVLREKISYTPKQIARLCEPISHPTRLWEIPSLVQRILELYHAMLDIVEKHAEDAEIPWKNRNMRRYLAQAARGEKPRNPFHYAILPAFLRLAEERVRNEVAEMPKLSTSSAWEEMERRLPLALREKVIRVLETHPLSPITIDDIEALPKASRLAKRLRVKWLHQLSKSSGRASVLNAMDEDEACIFLQHAEVKKTESPLQQKIRILLQERRRWKRAAQPQMPKKVEQLVDATHKQELAAWMKAPLQTADRMWYEALEDQVKAWSVPKARTLNLDRQAIRHSRRALADTVALVDRLVENGSAIVAHAEHAPTPIDEEMNDKENTTEKEKPTALESIVEEAALADASPEERLVDRVAAASEGLPMAEVEQIAQEEGRSAAGLIAAVNDAYFDEIGAQLLFEEEKRLWMDPADAAWWQEKRDEHAGK